MMITRYYFFFCSLIFFGFAVNALQAQVLTSIDFSHQRGFYKQSFDLKITIDGYNITTKYTVDGSEPDPDHGIIPADPNGFTITGINRSTVIRVYAHNIEDTISTAHTYIFEKDVFEQNNNIVINELVYPPIWGYGPKAKESGCVTQDADYDFSKGDCITKIPSYEQRLIDGLKEIPTIAISLDKNQVFGKDSGLYIFPLEESNDCYTLPQNVHSWERKASVEIFNDIQEDGDTSDFQVDGGLSISGASTRNLDFYKHSFKLKFRSEYGAGKLKYPLFGKEAIKKIETIQLRMVGQCSPSDWNQERREATQFHKDGWVKHLQRELSGYGTSPHSKFFHLFINGLYWGIYDVTERPDEDYMAAYYGGEPEDYDVIKVKEVKNGSNADYNYMFDIAHSIYDTTYLYGTIPKAILNEERALSFYNEIDDYLDLQKFRDYVLLNIFLVNRDWKDNNWWAARNANDPNSKFQFFVWDAEFVVEYSGDSNSLIFTYGKYTNDLKYHPIDLHQRLMEVPEYKIKFADDIQCRCVEEDGILNTDHLLESYTTFEQKIHNASLLEFARWGDVRKRDLGYAEVCYSVVENTLERYKTIKIPQLLPELMCVAGIPSQEIFPNFINRTRKNGESTFNEIYNFKAVKFPQLGGEVSVGYQLKLSNPNTKVNQNNQNVSSGEIYYTTDGSDPRNLDGSISSTAIKYTGPISIDGYKMIKARVYAESFEYKHIKDKTIENLWSAMCPREFFPKGYYDNLVINEIHYHPAPISDTDSGKNLEFLELKNIGGTELNISNTKFTDGIKYQFPMGSKIAGNGYALLAVDSVAAKNYYNVNIDGEYTGKLENSGELIVLSKPNGEILDAVDYDDEWDARTDGKGPSLSLYLDQFDKKNNHLKESWGGSAESSTPRIENLFCIPYTFDFYAVEPTCYGASDGFINLTVTGGTGNLTYEWLGLQNISSSLISNLTAGEYEVKITDEQGCIESKKTILGDPQPINSNLQITHASATNSSDGSAIINPNNEPNSYTVTWSDGTNGNTNNNLSPNDNYWVTITSNQYETCSITESFAIEVASTCSMPTSLAAIATSNESAVITWLGNTNNSEYIVSYKASYDTIWNTVETTMPNLLLNNLNPCTYYNYKVSASCNSVISNISTVKTFATSGCNKACQLNNVVANTVNVTNYSAFILWDIVPNSKYRLNYRKNGINTWNQYETSYNFAILFGLDKCSNYQWFVEVICPNGAISSNSVNNFTSDGCARQVGGINENKEDTGNNFEFSLYPNPAQNFININSNYTGLPEMQLLVYDLAGKIVKYGGTFVDQTTLNIEDLQAGIYVAQIVNNSNNLQYRFKKE